MSTSENGAALCSGRSLTKISGDRVADIGREGHALDPLPLAAHDDLTRAPPQVVETQGRHFDGARSPRRASVAITAKCQGPPTVPDCSSATYVATGESRPRLGNENLLEQVSRTNLFSQFRHARGRQQIVVSIRGEEFNIGGPATDLYHPGREVGALLRALEPGAFAPARGAYIGEHTGVGPERHRKHRPRGEQDWYRDATDEQKTEACKAGRQELVERRAEENREHLINSGATIDPTARIERNVEIADRTEIGRSCRIKRDTKINHDTKIGEHCTLEPGCRIGRRVTIGGRNEDRRRNRDRHDTTTGRNCDIEVDITIAEHAVIGDDCTVAEATKIYDDARIGRKTAIRSTRRGDPQRRPGRRRTRRDRGLTPQERC